MTEAEQLAFIQERTRHVQTLIGDEPTEFGEEALRSVKVEIDDYVEEKVVCCKSRLKKACA